MNKELLIEHMKSCYQIKDKQTVLEHGESVWSHFQDLWTNQELSWKLPSWFIENKDWIKENILPLNVIKEYMIMHDCGKPFCQHYDADG